MPGIFICYRREDTAGHTGRLFDRLRERFGADGVFLDVAGIEAGVDFTKVIERAVGSCSVLLAMVGKDWVTLADANGRRRLDAPDDFIRLEIATALKRDIRVIPILVEGARVPGSDVLPDELKPLNHRQAVELRDSRWDSDVKDLVGMLERLIDPPLAVTGTGTGDGKEPPPIVTGTGSGRPRRSGLWWVAALLGLAAIGVTLYVFATRGAVADVTVPDVMGLTRDSALKMLQAAPLEPLEVEEPAHDVPVGHIMRQHPPKDTRVSRGAFVTIVIAAGERRMPDVTRKRLPEAIEALTAAGIGRPDVKEEESASPEDTVLRQEPAAGEDLSPGTRVVLVVARGRAVETVTVPNVFGQPVDDAIEMLKQAGLSPEARAGKPDAKAAVRSVVQQEPGPGTAVARGSRVEIVFVPPRATVTMPNVVGKAWADAREILARAGIRVTVVQVPEAKATPDTVLSQSPGPGTELALESATVELRVAMPVPVDQKPAGITVLIYYGEGSEAAAKGLADHLKQQLKSVEIPGWRLSTVTQGQVRYFYAEDERTAEALAKRATYWLNKNGRPEVSLAPIRGDAGRSGAKPGLMEIRIPGAKEDMPKVRTKQVLQIRSAQGADLDEGVLAPAETADIWFEMARDGHRYLSPMNGVGFAWSSRSPATPADCAGAKYGLTNLEVERFSRAPLCVRTNGGRYALLSVHGMVGARPGSLEVSFITWEK